eukprot:6977347-Pyramimonas_sp.AAC.1
MGPRTARDGRAARSGWNRMRAAGETHVMTAAGTFGGAPYGATKRVRGVPKMGRGGAREDGRRDF